MPPRMNTKRVRDSSNGSGDKGKAPAIPDLNGGDSDSAVAENLSANQPQGRLVQNPHENHIPETYDDLVSDFYPEIFSNLESYLPTNMLNASRDDKVQYMRVVLNDYLPQVRDQKQREYKQWILLNYKLRHQEICIVDPTTFFVPTFLKAIMDNTEQSFKSIISEPAPGVFTFEMFQPHFCELLLSEVENFEKWASATKLQVMRPTTINKYGAVLDDFGLQSMLNDLMGGFISPLSKVLFEDIGGSTLDSHHGFVVEYGMDRDVELGFHVDDSEVTLNVCLGKQFSGGELYFRGMRCENHVNTESYPKEIFDYSQVPGQAVLHHGRHRHGARATTSGYRANLIMWCRSSCFRELIRHQTNFSSFCAKCYKERKTELRQSMDGIELGQTRGEGETSSMDVSP